ncbi:hypothetical protein NP493_568g01003 [Ridgeia piscesae]|uniref:Uncharacterized protein n=1 Tax=Ridgeia piscesae TaxID=27915 RepID=A0AAD9NRF8_RIDPI|nr:hypothetical protein NP493_568g01003 [Ridgeia piscesae]
MSLSISTDMTSCCPYVYTHDSTVSIICTHETSLVIYVHIIHSVHICLYLHMTSYCLYLYTQCPLYKYVILTIYVYTLCHDVHNCTRMMSHCLYRCTRYHTHTYIYTIYIFIHTYITSSWPHMCTCNIIL